MACWGFCVRQKDLYHNVRVGGGELGFNMSDPDFCHAAPSPRTALLTGTVRQKVFSNEVSNGPHVPDHSCSTDRPW